MSLAKRAETWGVSSEGLSRTQLPEKEGGREGGRGVGKKGGRELTQDVSDATRVGWETRGGGRRNEGQREGLPAARAFMMGTNASWKG